MPTFLVFFISVPVYFFQLDVFASTKEKNILSSHFAIFILFFLSSFCRILFVFNTFIDFKTLVS